MILIGITGGIGSGKSTFADFLAAQVPNHGHVETGGIIAEVGTAFNTFLARERQAADAGSDSIVLVNRVMTMIAPQLAKTLGHEVSCEQILIDPDDTLQHPELYVKLFTYLAQIDATPEILQTPITVENKDTYRTLLQWLGGYLPTRLDPLLWFKEAMRRVNYYFAKADLVVIAAVRYQAEADYLHQLGGKIMAIVRPELDADTTDVTERERRFIQPDIQIINNGGKSELQYVALQMAGDLRSGQLKSVYTAKQ